MSAATDLIVPSEPTLIIADDLPEVAQWWVQRMQENSLSLHAMSRETGIHASTLTRLFNGKYGAKPDQMWSKLDAARENISTTPVSMDFIPTSLAKQMWEIFDEARSMQTIFFLWGEKGIGKTSASREFAARKKQGHTTYHRSGPALTFNQWVASLGLTLNIDIHKVRDFDLREAIIKKITSGNRLLILDEFHQIFVRPRHSDIHAVLICEFIREIFDRAECGVVTIGTKAMITAFLDTRHAGALEQLMDRGEPPIELPPKPTKKDAALFVSHYGLDPLFSGAQEAAAIVTDIFASNGLRKLVIRLRAAAKWAAKNKLPYTWDSFVAYNKHLSSITKKS